MNVLFEGNTATGKDEWLTPPSIIKACGEFDLDPCSPIVRPWATSKNHFTIEDDGLQKEWFGRVWCNPPYGAETGKWLEKAAMHGNTIALTFARTETKMFFRGVWDKADAIFFIKGRLKFFHVNGAQGDSAGAPSVLIAYGKNNVEALQNCGLSGKLVNLTERKNISEKEILVDALVNLIRSADLPEGNKALQQARDAIEITVKNQIL